MAKLRMINGKLVDPFNLGPDDLNPYVIIHHLCLINRFHGATYYPYSVAQHTRNLYWLVPEHLKRAAIVHDWSEAFFNDLAAPVKYECSFYTFAESDSGTYIANRFGVTQKELEELKEYDKRIYVNERNALQNLDECIGMGDDRKPLDIPDSIEPSVLFAEFNWRAMRNMLIAIFEKEFPEYVKIYNPLG